jgi:hypothetical protein
MVIHLAFQSTLDDHFRQLPQQPALAGQLQPAGAGPLGELPYQLLVSRRQLHICQAPVLCHVSHLVSPPVPEVTPLKLQSQRPAVSYDHDAPFVMAWRKELIL